jgi:hypothetical protein
MVVRLTDENERKLDALSRETGKPPEQLVNEAIEQLTPASAAAKRDWKVGWKRAAGMWKDRTDLDSQEIRRSWEREFPRDDAQ